MKESEKIGGLVLAIAAIMVIYGAFFHHFDITYSTFDDGLVEMEYPNGEALDVAAPNLVGVRLPMGDKLFIGREPAGNLTVEQYGELQGQAMEISTSGTEVMEVPEWKPAYVEKPRDRMMTGRYEKFGENAFYMVSFMTTRETLNELKFGIIKCGGYFYTVLTEDISEEDVDYNRVFSSFRCKA